MDNRQQKPSKVLPDFGKPLDTKLLLGFATITNADKASALQWWNDNASPEWVGALDNKPIGKKSKR